MHSKNVDTKVADENHLLFPSVLWISRFNALKFFRVIRNIFSWKKRNVKEFLEKNPKIILLITWQIVQGGFEKKKFENQPFLLNYSYVGHIVFTIIQSSGRHEEEFDPRDIAILSTICKIRDKIALFFANQMFPRGFIEILAPQAKL